MADCDLYNELLRGVNLKKADLRDAEVKNAFGIVGTSFRGADVDGLTVPGGGLHGVALSHATAGDASTVRFSNVVISRVSLEHTRVGDVEIVAVAANDLAARDGRQKSANLMSSVMIGFTEDVRLAGEIKANYLEVAESSAPIAATGCATREARIQDSRLALYFTDVYARGLVAAGSDLSRSSVKRGSLDRAHFDRVNLNSSVIDGVSAKAWEVHPVTLRDAQGQGATEEGS